MKLLLSPLRNFLFGKATRTVVIIAAAVSAVFSVLVAARTPVAQIHPAHPSPAGITAVCATPPAGMVSWWPAENNAHDIVSHNNGTLTGGTGFASGEVGQAFTFDGSSGKITIPDSAASHPSDFTYDAWIAPDADSPTGDNYIICKGATPGQYYPLIFIQGNAGHHYWRVSVNGSASDLFGPADSVSYTFQHIAVTRQGDVGKLYIDGNLVDTQTVGTGTGEGYPLAFGNISNYNAGYFKGRLDEVEFFNRALTQSEIQAIFSAGSAGKCRTCYAPPPNMIGWWPGDGNTKDIQNGNTGTASGHVTFAPGEVAQAFNFNGSSFVSIGNPPELNVTGPEVTIDGWVNPSVDMSNEVIFFGKWGDGAIQYILEWENGTLEGRVNNGNVAVTFTPPTGVWTHLAMVYNGSANPSVVIYVNGVVLTSSAAQSGNINSTTSPFLIGGTPDGRDLNGLIDEVEVFNRALSADEIQFIYDAGTLGKCKPTCVDPPPGLLDWWPGDNTAIDIQSGHNGTLQNGATFANGKVDRAFTFNGSNQYVDVGFVGFPITFSIDAWINPTNLGNTPVIISSDDDNEGIDFFVNADGSLAAEVKTAGHAQFTSYLTAPGIITTGTWQHVVVTYDGGPDAGGARFKFYVNGINVPANVGGDDGGAPGNSTATTKIGRFGGYEADDYSGRIDEVEIFNRVLNPSEVASIYNAGSAGKCKTVRFYVSNNGNITIEKFDINGVDLGTFANASSGLKGPTGLAFDASGNLFVGNRGGQNILKFDSMGNSSVFADGASKGFEDSFGLGFNSIGNLYSPDDDLNIVFKFTPDGNGGSLASSHLSTPTNVAFDASGLLYVVNIGDGTVQTFDANSGAYQAQFVGGQHQPVGLVFDVNGQLYVSNTGTSTVEKFDSAGNDLGAFANVNGGVNIWGMVFDSTVNLYVADRGANAIYKFDPAGTQSTFASSPTANLNLPEFIATQLFSPTATSIQFDKPSYSVNEAAGSVTLTVTRNGDVSGSSTVHYATADGTGASPAISPGDYTATSGDFTFQPNDTSMTFQVPIIIDNDADPGSEPPSKTFTATLSNVTGAMLSGPATTTVTINDIHYTISVGVSGINQSGGTTSGEGGTVSGAGTYDSGSQVDLVVTPNDCFTFTSWTEGNTIVSTDPHLSFTASTGRNLVANFTIKEGCAGPCNSFATATIQDVSSEYPGREAVHVIDGSGLDSNNPPNHDTDPTHMWMSHGDGSFSAGTPDPDLPGQLAHITFNLGGTFRVNSFQVWNYNEFSNGQNFSNRGINTLTISTSIDGVNFTPQINPATNTTTWTFDQAPGSGTYTGQVVTFSTPLTATYVRFDIKSNYGPDPSDNVDRKFVGLSEIRFNMCPVSCVPPPANMLAWWKGDGNANDSVGGHDGSLMSGATFGAGEVGQGFSFNGVGAFVSVAGPVANFGTGDFTIDFWMQTSSTVGTHEIINKRVCGNAPDAFEVRIGATILVELLRNNDGTGSNVTSTRSYNDGQFHHIAIVRSGNTLSIYGDGTLDNSIIDPNVGATNINNNLPLGIGGGGCADPNSGDGTATFLGVLDEIELFNRALSPDEIAGIVRAGGLGKCECTPPPANMISWWPAEGDTNDIQGGNTLSAGNGNGFGFGAGEVGQAFTFNGSQVLTAGTPSNLAITGTEVTIDGWIYPTSGGEALYFGKAQNAGNDYALYNLFGSNQLVAVINENFFDTGFVAPLNSWTHIALTYDGSTMKVYANGSLVGSTSQTGNINNSGSPFTIGGRAGDKFFNGSIDEVEVFNRALSDTEIAAIYHAGSAGKCRSCTPPPGGMVSWWPGDGNANDIQDGNNGTLQGGATFASGKVGQAFSFNGTSAHIEVPDSPSLNPTSQVTIDTWVKTSSDSRQGLVSKLNQSFSSPDGSYDLTIVNASLVEFFVNGVGYLRPAASVCDGQWHHLAGTYDGHTMSLYVDGTLAGSTSASGAITQSTRPLYLGAELRDNADSGFLNGQLDEVEIFNVALSGNQIAAIYDAGSGGKCKPATAPNRQLFNISTRAEVGTGDNVAIGGFIVHTDPSGTTAAAKTRTAVTNTKRVLIRGIGPSLAAFNVANPLQDPVLELHDGNGAIITTNDNWGDAPNASDIQATGLAPSNSLESAILITLNADASYTAILSGKNNTTGVGLVEVYDMDLLGNTHLINISTRGFVDTGDNVLIGGLIVKGGTPARVVVRAIGPSMTALGVADALPDPTLELHDGNGALIASNDDWGSSPDAGAITAAGLNPSNSKESAILFTPAPGSYTAIVRGNGPTPTGVGLVEAFRLKN